MPNPPPKKPSQTDYIKSAVRLPPDLHAELTVEAERAGRSLNAEMIARMQADHPSHIASELADIKAMLRKILDAVTQYRQQHPVALKPHTLRPARFLRHINAARVKTSAAPKDFEHKFNLWLTHELNSWFNDSSTQRPPGASHDADHSPGQAKGTRLDESAT